MEMREGISGLGRLNPLGVTQIYARAGLDGQLNFSARNLVTVLAELSRLLVFESLNVTTLSSDEIAAAAV